MRITRLLLALPGLAALAWGALLFAEYAFPLHPDVFGTVVWLVGAPVVNDALVAPAAAIAGLLLARIVPDRWKTPVKAGAVATAVLGILAFPLLWRPYGTPPEPGLHDGNPALGLAITVGVVWLLVALAGLRKRPRATGT